MNWDDYPNFERHEFECAHCGKAEMDELFMTKLQAIRTRAKFPFVINSGYRCPEYDASIGGKGNHTTGRAVDIGVSGDKAHALLRFSVASMSGVGVNQTGPRSSRFIHLDDLVNKARPTAWSY